EIQAKDRIGTKKQRVEISKARPSSPGETWRINIQQEMKKWARSGEGQRARLAQARPARSSDLRRSKRSVGHVSANPQRK
ncbi:hypothetical protein L195_g037824, partial [Trifolium pratense]